MRVKQIQSYLSEQNAGAFFIESATNRYYISGFTGTSGALLITREKAYFITDFRYLEQAKIEVEPNGFEIVNQQQHTIYDVVKSLGEEQALQTLLIEAAYMTLHEKSKLENTAFQLVETTGVVERMRIIKSSDEIADVKQAVRIIEKTFEYICEHIEVGMSEKEVSEMALSRVKKLGGSGMSFETIVASGIRSAFPHGVASDKQIAYGDIVTIDFGAYYNRYVSDMTRTIFIGEVQNQQLQEIYEIVREAKRRAISAIKPGVKTSDVDKIARDYIIEHGYGAYFGHGTGHGIGIDIHEAPRVSGQDETILEPGMIITVEPGIYLPQIGGVRIEDDILVTETGHENLMSLNDELIMLA